MSSDNNTSSSGLNRREFVGLSLAAGAGLAMGVPALLRRAQAQPSSTAAPAPAAPGAKLKILVLGGTGFIGPAFVEVCKKRGHSVTLFNRGKTEKRIGIIEDVEKLYGNRDPKLRADDTDPNSPQGLTQLEGKKWDAVLDTSGYVPRIVKASAELLAPNTGFYVFISSVSAYATNDKVDRDETDPVGKITDETVEEMGKGFENYGPLKALCEQAAEAAFPGRCANVRPGLIVGPGDPTDRFTYWPVRASQGGDMLTPGAPADPCQYIDVRDLADWLVLLIENKSKGVYNAIGPAKRAGFGAVVDASIAAGGKKTTAVWVPASFLEKEKVEEMPLWAPAEGETAGFHTRSNARAIAAGLRFRSVQDTCTATLEWWPKEVARRERVGKEMKEDAAKAGKPEPKLGDPTKLRAGITRERETELLAAWAKQKG